MRSKNPADYSRTAIALHWIAAALILGNLVLGLYMVDLQLSPAKLKYYSWHKWAGVTVFLLSALRLLWRLTPPAPALPAAMPVWQRRAAAASHALLYLLFFVAPLSGWLFSSAAGFPTVYFGVLQLPDVVTKSKELADVLMPYAPVTTGFFESINTTYSRYRSPMALGASLQTMAVD